MRSRSKITIQRTDLSIDPTSSFQFSIEVDWYGIFWPSLFPRISIPQPLIWLLNLYRSITKTHPVNFEPEENSLKETKPSKAKFIYNNAALGHLEIYAICITMAMCCSQKLSAEQGSLSWPDCPLQRNLHLSVGDDAKLATDQCSSLTDDTGDFRDIRNAVCYHKAKKTQINAFTSLTCQPFWIPWVNIP